MEHHLAGNRRLMMEKPGFFYILSQEHDSLLSLNGLVQASDRTLALSRQPGGLFSLQGSFLAGPFEVGQAPTAWHRLQAQTPKLPEGAHLRLFSRSSEQIAVPPLPPVEQYSGAADVLAPLDTWRAARRDARNLRLLNAPGRYLWVYGMLSSDGRATPQIVQLRVEYDRPSWLGYLPAIYVPGKGDPSFIDRSLALFQSMLDEQEGWIELLPRLFDPFAAPAGWLDWLAGWLAFELDDTWPEAKRRLALKRAFELQGVRGTVEGLTAMIQLYSGARTRIVEPARSVSLWSLGETSTLGFTTMLTPAQAQGAVLRTTADLGSSHLIGTEDYGSPLFSDLAHHFCVQVYAAEISGPAALNQLERVIEREKPAHTTYCVQVIDAELRVGMQARLGVDAIVSPADPEAVLDPGMKLGVDSVLPKDPRPNVLGSKSYLGMNAILASSTDPVEGGNNV